jgi:hypothetical protein
VRHISQHCWAYMQLLAPHLGDGHVAALFHLLAAHGQLDGALPGGSSEAAAYLDLLRVMAASMTSPPAVKSASAAAGGGLQQTLVPLLAATFRSMVAATAVIETSARQEVVGRLPAQQAAKQQSPAFQAKVDQRVRQVLPTLDGQVDESQHSLLPVCLCWACRGAFPTTLSTKPYSCTAIPSPPPAGTSSLASSLQHRFAPCGRCQPPSGCRRCCAASPTACSWQRP